MKKLIVAIILLASCSRTEREKQFVNDQKMYEMGTDTARYVKVHGKSTCQWTQEIEVFTIDSCEYLGYRVGLSDGILTHKGNCKHCEAKRAKIDR